MHMYMLFFHVGVPQIYNIKYSNSHQLLLACIGIRGRCFPGAVESLPKFSWRIVMRLPEFNLFSDKSTRIFLIFPSICPNFHGFINLFFWEVGHLPPCPTVSYAYGYLSSIANMYCTLCTITKQYLTLTLCIWPLFFQETVVQSMLTDSGSDLESTRSPFTANTTPPAKGYSTLKELMYSGVASLTI